MKPLAMFLIAVVACTSTTIVTRTERRIVIRVVPCLSQKPPTAAVMSGDERIDVARKADAYDKLEPFVRLVVVPSCSE